MPGRRTRSLPCNESARFRAELPIIHFGASHQTPRTRFGTSCRIAIGTGITPMLYMVIEHFKDGAVPEIYRRFREKGRLMPAGLDYVASWISDDMKNCWPAM